MICLGLGRLMFFVVYILQMVSLAMYLRHLYYPVMACLVLVLVPGLIAWLFLVFGSVISIIRPTNNIWIVWLLYLLGFVISVGTIFSQDVERLNETMTFGPNILKTTLCLTPVLLLLLLSTAISPKKNPKLVERLSMAIALDLFDGTEMLEVLLQQYHQVALGSWMKYAMLSSVLLSFLLSSMALYRHKFSFTLEEVKNRKRITIFYTLIRIVFVNSVYLILRAILWGVYKFSASIFITKNVFSITFCIIEIVAVCSFQKSSEDFVV